MRWRGTIMQNFIILKKIEHGKTFQNFSAQNLAPPISFYTPALDLR